MRRKAVRTLKPGLLLALILVAHPLNDSLASAQARDTVASLRTRYNTIRTQANPQGDRKSEFDALEREIARAARLGRTGDMRRLYTKGITLAQGNTWTPELEFASSLALRTERVFIDPRAPVAFRLEQISRSLSCTDADATAPVQRSRDVVAELKRLGAEHQYVEVPGGTHGNVVAPNLPAMFDFFDRHRKRAGTN